MALYVYKAPNLRYSLNFHSLLAILPLIPERDDFNSILVCFIEDQINLHWNYPCILIGS